MDHYNTLGIERNATDEDIKKNYRRLAMQFHPDRNIGDKECESKFKEVQQAYDVLSDAKKRLQYDQINYVRKPPTSSSKPAPPPPPPKTKEDFEAERARNERKANPREQDLASIQCSFFGGGGTGRNIMVHLKLTPAEMKHGGTKFITIKKRDLCKKCIGDGYAMLSCSQCGGRRPDVGYCPRCDGVGALESTCPICKGEGVKEWMIQDVKVAFSPNIQSGHTINIYGEGEAGPRKAPGLLRVVII